MDSENAMLCLSLPCTLILFVIKLANMVGKVKNISNRFQEILIKLKINILTSLIQLNKD